CCSTPKRSNASACRRIGSERGRAMARGCNSTHLSGHLRMTAEGLAETIRQECSADADRVVRAGPGQHFARPSRFDEGKISKSPAAVRSPGVEWCLVAVGVRVLTAAAAVP